MNHGKLIQQFGKLVEQGHLPISCAKAFDAALGEVRYGYDALYYDCLQVAIGFVEGKAVFTGDVLFDKTGYVINAFESKEMNMISDGGALYYLSELSWNPPKPETVTLEVSRECAEWYIKADLYTEQFVEVKQAAKKALEL